MANASAASASPVAIGPPTSVSRRLRSNRSAPAGARIRADGHGRAAARRLPWHGLVVRCDGRRDHALQQDPNRRLFFALGAKAGGLRRQIWLPRIAEL